MCIRDRNGSVGFCKFKNSSSHKLKSAYAMNIVGQEDVLNKVYYLYYSARVSSKPNLLLFQTGFLISIRSLECLFKELKCDEFTYLIAVRYSQDIVKKLLFSSVNTCKVFMVIRYILQFHSR